MSNLVKRNLLYTVRDRVAFFMSFISVIILIVVYKAFLGNFQIDSIKSASHLNYINSSGINMVNYWLIAGLTIVTSVTSVVNGLGVVVDDYESGKYTDFKLSGVSQLKISLSYYISSVIIGFIVTVLSLIFGIIIFVGFDGLKNFSNNELVNISLIILISSIVSSLFSMPFAIVMKGRSSFTIFSTIVGTLIGFISGVYISIGNVSSPIKNMMLSLPFIHEVTLLKHNLMLKSENVFFSNFGNHANQAKLSYDKLYGNNLYTSNGDLITLKDSIIFILCWIVGLILINIIINFIVFKRK